MDWSSGYSSRYYMSRLDKATLKDLDRIEITGGTIKKTNTDLRESADIDCVNYQSQQEELIRVWLDIDQNGASDHTPLFTGIATSPTNKYSGNVKTVTVQCYSLLKIAQDVLLPLGWYAPAKTSSDYLLRSLLSITGTEIIIDPEVPVIDQAIIAEQGENQLSMADKILSAIGWVMRMDGYGRIYISKRKTDSVARFNSLNYDIIEKDIDITYDWYAAPNVLRVTMDDQCAIARDDDPNSPLSTDKNCRGREVWAEYSDVQLNTGETLAEYAQKMLKYYQQSSTTLSYTRRFLPDVYPGDIVDLNYPAQDISGSFIIVDQSITLGYNARTSEEVIRYA